MKKKVLNFPCQCGHSKDSHEMTGPPINDGWCNWEKKEESSVEGYYLKYNCDCNWYIPDNLKYLEQQSKKKKRGKIK